MNTNNQTHEYTVTIPAGATSGTFAIPALEQPNGVYTFTAYGGNGNPSNVSASATLTTTNEIDPYPPNVPVISGDTTGHYNSWVNALQDFSVSYTETQGSPEWLEYAVVSGNVKSAADSAFVKVGGSDGKSESGRVNTSAAAVPLDAFGADGVYTVFFRTADASGLASAAVSQTVRYDTTPPAMGEISYSAAPYLPHNTYSYTKLFGEKTTVSALASDASASSALGDLAGGLTIEYTVVDQGASLDNATAIWNVLDSAAALPGDSMRFDGTLYFRATDEAGNTTDVSAYADTGLISVNLTAPAAITQVAADRADVADWSTAPVTFTLTSGENSDTTLDHYQYAISADGKTFGDWIDFDNTDPSTVENELYYTQNGAYHVKFRAVSYTGVAGEENVYGIVSKDDVAPALNVKVTGSYSSEATTANWTNQKVVFALSDAAENTSPLTYWVKVGTGDYTALTDGMAAIDLPGGGTAVWNSAAQTLTVSGDVDKCTGFAFKLTTQAGLSDQKSGYYLSMQQSTGHLKALSLANLLASQTPTGTVVTAGSDAGTLWYRAWYKNGDTAPDLILQNQNSYANENANGAPVCLEYTLKIGTTVKDSGTVELTEDAVQKIFCTAAKFNTDGTYTLTAKIVDHAGNATAAVTATIRMDTSAPTGASIKRGTTSYNMSGAAPV